MIDPDLVRSGTSSNGGGSSRSSLLSASFGQVDMTDRQAGRHCRPSDWQSKTLAVFRVSRCHVSCPVNDEWGISQQCSILSLGGICAFPASTAGVRSCNSNPFRHQDNRRGTAKICFLLTPYLSSVLLCLGEHRCCFLLNCVFFSRLAPEAVVHRARRLPRRLRRRWAPRQAMGRG